MVYNKIKNYLTREDAEKNTLKVHSIFVTRDLAYKITGYMSKNNLMTDVLQEDGYSAAFDEDYKKYKNHPKRIRTVMFWYTPIFSVKDYGNIFLIFSEGSVATTNRRFPGCEPMRKGSENKARRSKTIMDLYFDILAKYPNDIIDIRFDVFPKSCPSQI